MIWNPFRYFREKRQEKERLERERLAKIKDDAFRERDPLGWELHHIKKKALEQSIKNLEKAIFSPEEVLSPEQKKAFAGFRKLSQRIENLKTNNSVVQECLDSLDKRK